MAPKEFRTPKELEDYAAETDRIVVSQDVDLRQGQLRPDEYEVVKIRSSQGMMRRLLVTKAALKAQWQAERLFYETLQGGSKRRIGVLMAYEESIAEAQGWVVAFREGLRSLGWTEGSDFQINVRWATGEKATIARFAKEMVA